MRKIVALAALISFMPVANAADKAEMTPNAEYRIRYQIDEAKTGDKGTSTTAHTATHRFKMDLGFRSGEKFGGNLTLLHNAQLGGFSTSNGEDNQQKSAFIAENSVLVNQAYGTWMINDAWSAKFGRGGFTLADGSVISQNDWEGVPYSFDGALLNYEHEMVRLNIFGVKAVDNAAAFNGSNNDDPEVNFFGFAADWKNLPEVLKMVNFHFTKVSGNELELASIRARDEMRYGLVVSGDTAGIDYRLNYAANTGDQKSVSLGNRDVDGMMYALEVGFSLPEMMKSRFFVGYHVDSGDKNSADDKLETYDTFFYEKHCNSGCMDVLNWGNLTFIKAGYTFTPMDQIDVGLHFWKFERTEDRAAATLGNNGAYTNVATVTSSDLGQEIDLVVTKKYDSGFAINAWLGMFMPGDYFAKQTTPARDDTYNQLYVEGKMTF